MFYIYILPLEEGVCYFEGQIAELPLRLPGVSNSTEDNVTRSTYQKSIVLRPGNQ